MEGFWYLGSPYSKYPDGTAMAHKIVCEEAARLILAGVSIYSPIACSHPIALYADMPLGYEFWEALDKPFIEAAKGMIILTMESWERSHGLLYEEGEFRAAGKPIVFMESGTVPVEVLS